MMYCNNDYIRKKEKMLTCNSTFLIALIEGIDMTFLKTAISMAKTAVYSLHKTSTREVSPRILKFDSVSYSYLEVHFFDFACVLHFPLYFSIYRKRQMIGM